MHQGLKDLLARAEQDIGNLQVFSSSWEATELQRSEDSLFVFRLTHAQWEYDKAHIDLDNMLANSIIIVDSDPNFPDKPITLQTLEKLGNLSEQREAIGLS